MRSNATYEASLLEIVQIMVYVHYIFIQILITSIIKIKTQTSYEVT